MYLIICFVVPICTYRYIIPIGIDAIGIGLDGVLVLLIGHI